MQPTGTIYVTYVVDHPKIIPVKFHQAVQEEKSFEAKMGVAPGRGKSDPRGMIYITFVDNH